MCTTRVLLVFPMFMFLQVNALSGCDSKIVDKILKTSGCPKDVLNKLHGLGPYTQALLPAADVADVVQCVSGSVDAPTDNTARASATTYFKSKSMEPLVMGYRQEEDTCGHVQEWFKDTEYQIYLLSVDEVACYYRCSTGGPEGPPFGGAVVPISKRNDSATVAAVTRCKKGLAAVGVEGGLVDVETCSQ